MSPEGTDATHRRLLEAAVGLFASQGFAATSVRQVCEKADANVAAVNYHFRSKRGLYDASIDFARGEAIARNRWVGLDAGRDFWADETPETRLRFFVAMLLDHSLDGGGKPSDLARIMIHEMLDPTEAFERQMEVSVSRVFDALCDVCRAVAAALGCENAPRESIARIAFLVSAQCLYPALVAGVVSELHPGVSFDDQGREQLGELIASSAVSSLGALR